MNAQAAVICLNPKTAGPDGAPYLVTNTSTVQGAVGYLWSEKRRNRGDSGACPGPHVIHRHTTDTWYDVAFGDSKTEYKLVPRPAPPGTGEPGEHGDRLVQVD